MAFLQRSIVAFPSALVAARRNDAARALATASVPPNAMALVKQLREKSGAPISEVKACLTECDWDVDEAYDALRRKGLAAAAKKASRHAADGLVGVAQAEAGACAALVEINSETDFVARSDLFQGLVSEAARALLANQQAAAAPPGVQQFDAEQLSDLVLGGGRLSDKVAEVGAAVREAIKLRRGFLVSGGADGYVSSYSHMPVAPGLGRIASVVVLTPNSRTTSEVLPVLGSQLAMHVAGLKPLYRDQAGVDQAALAHERALLTEQAAGSGKPEAVVAKMVEGRLKKWYQEVCLLEQRFLLDDSATVAQLLRARGKELGVPPGLGLPCFLRVQVGEGLEQKAAPGFADEVAAMAKQG